MILSIHWFRQRVLQSDYEMASHADEERQEEKITMGDLEAAILSGEIIEDYKERNDVRGHSCLILGYGESGDPIHIVVARTPKDRMRFCTVYRPQKNRFKDSKFRRSK